MTNSFSNPLNVSLVEKALSMYPKLEVVWKAGTLSGKVIRDILGIDRHEAYALILDLVAGGAFYGCGSSCYKASDALKDYMMQREGTVTLEV